METRANHLLIGGFVILVVAAAFGFIAWLAQLRIDRDLAAYDIQFTDAVSGLGVGGDVRFNGVKVGAVSHIVINRDDPNRVRVTVEIGADTPVRTDSVATLELQGVTGLSYVQISGGSPAAAMLPARRTAPLPVIASRPSKFTELFAGAPDLVNRGILLLERAADLINDENRANLSEIVGDLRTVSRMFAGRDREIGRAIDSFARVGDELAGAAKAARTTAEKLDQIADSAGRTVKGVDALIADTRKTAASINALAEDLRAFVANNRGPVETFTTDGLAEIRRFVHEARILVGSMARVAARIEDDPSQVLFGSRDSEFTPERR